MLKWINQHWWWLEWVYIDICVGKWKRSYGGRRPTHILHTKILTERSWTNKTPYGFDTVIDIPNQYIIHIYPLSIYVLLQRSARVCVCACWRSIRIHKVQKQSFLLFLLLSLLECAWKSILLLNSSTHSNRAFLFALTSLCLLCMCMCICECECVFVFFSVYRIAGDSGVCRWICQ